MPFVSTRQTLMLATVWTLEGIPPSTYVLVYSIGCIGIRTHSVCHVNDVNSWLNVREYATLVYHVKSITAANFCSLLTVVVPSECDTKPWSFISDTCPVTLARRILILSSSLPSSPSRVTRFG